MQRKEQCPLCGTAGVELRYFNRNDCGGCETCDQHFGGVFVCGKASCPERQRQIDAHADPTVPEEYRTESAPILCP